MVHQMPRHSSQEQSKLCHFVKPLSLNACAAAQPHIISYDSYTIQGPGAARLHATLGNTAHTTTTKKTTICVRSRHISSRTKKVWEPAWRPSLVQAKESWVQTPRPTHQATHNKPWWCCCVISPQCAHSCSCDKPMKLPCCACQEGPTHCHMGFKGILAAVRAAACSSAGA